MVWKIKIKQPIMIYDHGFQFLKKSNTHLQNYQFLFVISWKPQGFCNLWTTKIDSFLVFLKTWSSQFLDFEIYKKTKVKIIKKIECLLNTTLFQGLVLPFDLQAYCVLCVPCIVTLVQLMALSLTPNGY